MPYFQQLGRQQRGNNDGNNGFEWFFIVISVPVILPKLKRRQHEQPELETGRRKETGLRIDNQADTTAMSTSLSQK
jgi:hypothetical protein